MSKSCLFKGFLLLVGIWGIGLLWKLFLIIYQSVIASNDAGIYLAMDKYTIILIILIFVFLLMIILARKGQEKSINPLRPIFHFFKNIWFLIIIYLSELIIVIGGLLIAWRLFFPPKYVFIQGSKIIPQRHSPVLYLEPDLSTAFLQSLGIAILTGLIWFILKKLKLTSKKKLVD